MSDRASRQAPRPSQLRADKRRAILDAAARTFMRDGFGLAGVDRIVEESGVSKRTLYAHFPSKEALFGAIIHEYCDVILTPLRQADLGDRDPRETLIALGRTFWDVLLSPEGLSLYRVVVAEAGRFPDLGRVFYESGHEPAARLLTAYIQAQVDDGVFRDVDSRRAAEGFFGLVRGYVHERALFHLTTEVDPDALEASLRFAADVFLHGLRRRDAEDHPSPHPAGT
ncbi:TetR/AcrR family transcriptional regulator C-terminal domain-containing protein [Roseospira visakhapatnamensis]|uniref:AcrR family transcriptional regulator n=1 Tax=Roseospira visakhapatnamensis TaxID=390880 RepID=A0A7W6REF4_9PROT|nr:TetR/AcrR family transcriptional regulator C-terminal domain-containing protein [Roseospira visakhapatnamensis]MBB4266519.1 AcrR family transcriptional regulator [Roseospira visakhapatnamensis]